MGKTGCVLFNACIWLFSSTHRTKAQSGGFSDLFHKERIVGQLEGFRPMRLKTKQAKEAIRHGGRNGRLLSKTSDTPVCAIGRLASQRLVDKNCDFLVTHGSWSAGAQFVVHTGTSIFQKSLAPIANRIRGYTKFLSDLVVGHVVSRTQYDACSPHYRSWQRAGAKNTFKLFSLFSVQYQ
jgi:hypothetical protein